MSTRFKIHPFKPVLNVFFGKGHYYSTKKVRLPETQKLKIKFSNISQPHFSFSQKIIRFNNEKVSN